VFRSQLEFGSPMTYSRDLPKLLSRQTFGGSERSEEPPPTHQDSSTDGRIFIKSSAFFTRYVNIVGQRRVKNAVRNIFINNPYSSRLVHAVK